MNKLTFNMQNALDAVDPMVVRLTAAVRPALSEDTRFRFEICISEILTNLVVHTLSKGSGTDVVTELNVKPGAVSVEIFDPVNAEPFDLREHATDLSQVDAMAENGRGLGLILECADEVRYGWSGDGNSLQLEFRDDAPINTNKHPIEGASE